MLSRKLLENNEITKLIYALKNSVLLKEATYFCKLTDRLKVDNIDRFIKLADMNGTYFWTIGLNKIKKISSGVETRFYGIPIKAYKDADLMLNNYHKESKIDEKTYTKFKARLDIFAKRMEGYSHRLNVKY